MKTAFRICDSRNLNNSRSIRIYRILYLVRARSIQVSGGYFSHLWLEEHPNRNRLTAIQNLYRVFMVFLFKRGAGIIYPPTITNKNIIHLTQLYFIKKIKEGLWYMSWFLFKATSLSVKIILLEAFHVLYSHSIYYFSVMKKVNNIFKDDDKRVNVAGPSLNQ